MDKQYGKYKYKVSNQITHHLPKEEYESKIDCTVEPLGMTGANIYGPAIGATQLEDITACKNCSINIQIKIPYTKYDSSPFGSNVLDQKVPVENCGVGIETWTQNFE